MYASLVLPCAERGWRRACRWSAKQLARKALRVLRQAVAEAVVEASRAYRMHR